MTHHRVQPLVFVTLSLLVASCHTTPSAPSDNQGGQNEQAVRQQMASYIEVGELRPYTASGPRFALPDEYYDFAKRNPKIAVELLDAKLKSPDANIRCNAYDFFGHLASVPEMREKSIAILERAVETEGFAIQQFVKPTLNRLEADVAPR